MHQLISQPKSRRKVIVAKGKKRTPNIIELSLAIWRMKRKNVALRERFLDIVKNVCIGFFLVVYQHFYGFFSVL